MYQPRTAMHRPSSTISTSYMVLWAVANGAPTAVTTINLIEPLALHRRARVAHLCMGTETLCGAPNKHFRLFRTVTRPGKVVPVPVTDLPLCNRCGRVWLAAQKHAVRFNRSILLRHHAERRQVLSTVPAGQTSMRDLFPNKVLS